MLRLTESAFRGQVLRAHVCCVWMRVGEREREKLCVCASGKVCVYY